MGILILTFLFNANHKACQRKKYDFVTEFRVDLTPLGVNTYIQYLTTVTIFQICYA